jgi:hypothetical protein
MIEPSFPPPKSFFHLLPCDLVGFFLNIVPLLRWMGSLWGDDSCNYGWWHGVCLDEHIMCKILRDRDRCVLETRFGLLASLMCPLSQTW